jgi:hypothetical protein
MDPIVWDLNHLGKYSVLLKLYKEDKNENEKELDLIFSKPLLFEDLDSLEHNIVEKADKVNDMILEKNRFLSALLSVVIKDGIEKRAILVKKDRIEAYLPEDKFMDLRKKKIENAKKDEQLKLRAMEYLWTEFSLAAFQDYKIEEVIETANEKSFEKAIQDRILNNNNNNNNKKLRVKPKGLRSRLWSGKEEEPDSLGQFLVWKKAEDHIFFMPHIEIEIQSKKD